MTVGLAAPSSDPTTVHLSNTYGTGVATTSDMPDPEDDRVSKKVVYEQVSSSSGGNNAWMLVVIAVIVIAIVGYVLLHMHH
jgi:hypothetical protein